MTMIQFPKKGDRFLWMGVYCFVKRSSPTNKWADLLCVQTTGASWDKRQKVTDKMLEESLPVDRDKFPAPGTGLTPEQDRELARTAGMAGYQRECSLGNHGGCSDLVGTLCKCPCHAKVLVTP